MFCTKCGKQLHDGDIFCANCGSKVRQEEKSYDSPKYDDVVFNPPFKLEAQRRTEEISREVSKYSSEPKRERVDFDWNLEGFPGSKPKTEDDFKFNWDDVLEKKRRTRDIDVEKIVPDGHEPSMMFRQPEPAAKETSAGAPADEVAADTDKDVEEKGREASRDTGALSIEELEKALFGQAPTEVSQAAEKELEMTLQYRREDLNEEKDKFYTFNAKKDAFQELLDRERAHIERLEEEHKSQWEPLTPDENDDKQPKEPPDFEEIFVEPEIFNDNYIKEVDIAMPPVTAAVVAEESEAAEEPPFQQEPEEEQPEQDRPSAEPEAEAEPEPEAEKELAAEAELTSEEKTRLRFSDVFPREDIDPDGGGDDAGDDASGEEQKEEEKPKIEKISFFDDEDDDDEDEEKKKNPVLKTIIIILAVLVAVELVVIGVKLIAPDSGFSKGVDKLVAQVTGLFTGEDEGPEADEAAQLPATTFVTEYISKFSEGAANIGAVSENTDLKYNLDNSYAFEEIPQTTDFQNGVWRVNLEEEEITVGEKIVELIISHYNDKEALSEGVVGVNSVEIGEIRTGETGYYILNKVAYAMEEGGEAVKHETVYIASTPEEISVKEVREESL